MGDLWVFSESRVAPVIAILQNWKNLLPQCTIVLPLRRNELENAINRTMNFQGLSCYKSGDNLHELALEELTFHYASAMPHSTELTTKRQARVKKALCETFNMVFELTPTNQVKAADVAVVLENWRKALPTYAIWLPHDPALLYNAINSSIMFVNADHYKAGTDAKKMALEEIWIHYYNELLRTKLVFNLSLIHI